MARRILLLLIFCGFFWLFNWASGKLTVPIESLPLLTLDVKNSVYCISLAGKDVVKLGVEYLSDKPLELKIQGGFIASPSGNPGVASMSLSFIERRESEFLNKADVSIFWDTYFLKMSEQGASSSQIHVMIGSDRGTYTHQSIVDGTILIAKRLDEGSVQILLPKTESTSKIFKDVSEYEGSISQAISREALLMGVKSSFNMRVVPSGSIESCNLVPLSDLVNKFYLSPQGIISLLFNDEPQFEF